MGFGEPVQKFVMLGEFSWAGRKGQSVRVERVTDVKEEEEEKKKRSGLWKTMNWV